MTLLEARLQFRRCLGRFLGRVEELGVDLLLDESKRSREAARWNATHCRVQLSTGRCERTRSDPAHGPGRHEFLPIGIERSVHVLGLAQDAYVIVDGAISNDRALYHPLGQYWKGLHELARWGGDFEGFADLGHFSFEWQGRK